MDKNLNEKICIVGAGPSGMSAAWFLQKKGYKDITVLERLDRVGGKCNSPVYNGKHYEMGAGIGCPTYKTTLEIMKDIGMDSFKPKQTAKIYDPITGKSIEGMAEEEKEELKKQALKLKQIQEKYPEIKKSGHLNCSAELMLPFRDFCIKNKIPLVMKILINPCTGFGYGYFHLVPAAYVLKYMDFDTMYSFFNRDFISWEKGSESLWHKLNTKLNRKVRLCTHIEKVVREEGKVYVYTDFGKEVYDKIIFTAPLQDLPSYVNTTEEENDLFSKITYMDYKTFACTVENNPHTSGYIPGNMMPSRAGHVMFFYNRWDEDDNVITFYCLADEGEKVNDEDCRKYIEEDIKLLGLNLKSIVMHKSWRYFPHVNGDHMRHGWYDRIENLQGENNTYYAGEIMSFSDIEECAKYSKDIVETFF